MADTVAQTATNSHVPPTRKSPSKKLPVVFILAGGLSTRMGRDKALIQFGGETVVEGLARMASKVSAHVFVVVDRADKVAGLNLDGAKVLEDAIPRRGPLGGIYTALTTANKSTATSRRRQQEVADWNLFLTCDMPLITVSLLRKLVAAQEKKADAAHFVLANELMPQPFPLLLHRRVAQRISRRIKSRRLSVLALLDSLEVKRVFIKSASVRTRFVNVNTPAMLRRARGLLSK